MSHPLQRFGAWLENRTEWAGGSTVRARLIVQLGFAAVTIWLGLALSRFYHAARSAGPGLVERAHSGSSMEELARVFSLPSRPSGVDAFLPISGLLGLVDWIFQGHLNAVHPAATVTLLIFLLISLLLRKAFCGWICPVGFLSEIAALPIRMWKGRGLRFPRWLDIPLRGLKYLILGFFMWSVLSMSPESLRAFIESGYNRVAEIKMYLFFAHPSVTTIATLSVLVLASLFVRGFWCRYLCPYGALLGVFSWLSPTKVVRDPDACVSCRRCDRACWANLSVSESSSVTSTECSGCLECVASCPEDRALAVRTFGWDLGVTKFAAAVVLVFLAGYVVARMAGAWDNGIEDIEYIYRILRIERVGHP